MSALGAAQPTPIQRPAECLTAGVAFGSRRFLLCLVAAHYGRNGIAVFTEVTSEDDAGGEPRHDIFQDVGSWCIDASDEGPSVLKVDCLASDDLTADERATVLDALVEQVGDRWSDTWERQS